jgi:hypothetical protein
VLCTLLLGALSSCVGVPAAQAAIAINDTEVAEANGTVAATFTVTRTAGLLAGATAVGFTTVDGSAHAPADYAAATGTLTFPGALLGATQTQQLTIAISGDRLDEPAETLHVVLTGAEVTKGDGVATIDDDDPQPTISVGDAPAAPEGAVAAFQIALSAPSGRDVLVAYTTVNGSAVAGLDYTARGGTIGIPAGATSASLGVPLLDDSADEPSESFELHIGSASGATLGDASATATILDTDQPSGTPPSTSPPGSGSGQPPALGGSGSNPGSGTGTGGVLPQLGLSSPRLQRPSTVLVTVSCPRQSGTCSGRVTVFSRPSRRSRIKALRRERRLGRETFTLTGGGTKTLQIALSRRDRVLLRRAGRISVRAYAVTQDGAGRTGVRRVNGTLIGRTTHSG